MTTVQLEIWMTVAARFLVAAVFLLNAFGIIDQSKPADELEARGFPKAIVPTMMMAARALELLAGSALALGIVPQFAASFLLIFIVSATFISHAFWSSLGQPNFQQQLVNFFKNFAIWGALLMIAVTPDQPLLMHLHF